GRRMRFLSTMGTHESTSPLPACGSSSPLRRNLFRNGEGLGMRLAARTRHAVSLQTASDMMSENRPESARRLPSLSCENCFAGRGWGWGLRRAVSLLAALCLILTLFVPTISAQEPPVDPAAAGVTFDDVNRVAAGMYCPECEYIPLDKCYSPVCVQWKEEIAVQLAEGRTDQEIINGFVARFGDQVLGIPQDETLRNLSIYVPYIALIVIALVGAFTFLRWSRGRPTVQSASSTSNNTDTASAHYRSQLERDLEG